MKNVVYRMFRVPANQTGINLDIESRLSRVEVYVKAAILLGLVNFAVSFPAAQNILRGLGL